MEYRHTYRQLKPSGFPETYFPYTNFGMLGKFQGDNQLVGGFNPSEKY
jgi:hypothetical protein